MPDLLSLATRQRAQLEAIEEAELQRIIDAYQARVDALEGDIDALSRDLADPEITEAQILALESYKRLIAHAEQELERYAGFLAVEVGLSATAMIALAGANSRQLLLQSFVDAGLAIAPKILSTDATTVLMRFLKTDGELYNRIAKFAEFGVAGLRDTILNGVQYGINPREIARLIVQNGFGQPLTDAIRIMRTVQLYSYREATRANYLANSDVVKGWVWFSALIPGRTCMSCVVMHGTIHGLDETLNDHHNGLCTMLPLLDENPVKVLGEAWFDAQAPSTQQLMMGLAKYEAWQAGKFSFAQLSSVHDDAVYGPMRVEASLKSILGE